LSYHIQAKDIHKILDEKPDHKFEIIANVVLVARDGMRCGNTLALKTTVTPLCFR
jgi:hypothetical protein